MVFFRRDRTHLVDLDAPIRHAPDLCMEVLSPSTADADRGRKMQMFARYRVPEYWIVDAKAETVEVYRLSEAAYAVATIAGADEVVVSPTIERLTFTAASLFVH